MSSRMAWRRPVDSFFSRAGDVGGKRFHRERHIPQIHRALMVAAKVRRSAFDLQPISNNPGASPAR